jgi:rare lipoprotein A
MKRVLWFCVLLRLIGGPALADSVPARGIASWYGEELRGKLMANGKKFNPNKLTAASWFYPLGTFVRVTTNDGFQKKSVVVKITDRGPAKRLVKEGRIIDLGHAAFAKLAHPDLGLVFVTVEPVDLPSLAAR